MGRHRILASAYLAFPAAFGWLFYQRYWKWRDCINEALSSSITPDGRNLISGGTIWGVLAGVLAAAALRPALRGSRQ